MSGKWEKLGGLWRAKPAHALDAYSRPRLPVISNMDGISELMKAIDGNLGNANMAWQSASRAFYYPLKISAPYLVQMVWWLNGTGTAAGSVDVGVTTPSGQVLLHNGGTTQSGTSKAQSVTITPFLLLPGSYYLAMSSSTATGTYLGSAVPIQRHMQMMGIQQAASQNPLANSPTFAAAAGGFMPVFGISSITTI